MPSEEWFLIGLLLVIGAVRIFAAIAAGKPLDAEPTLGLAMFVFGLWWGLRSFRMRKRHRVRSGKMHDLARRDRAVR
jgi:hypothetical protein